MLSIFFKSFLRNSTLFFVLAVSILFTFVAGSINNLHFDHLCDPVFLGKLILVNSSTILVDGVYFVFTGALLISIGVPRQVVCLLGGYTFGFISGTILSLLASITGCAGGFYCSRFLARAIVERNFPGKIYYLNEVIRSRPFFTTLAFRLLPVSNNLLTNLIAGVSIIHILPFLTGSILGYLPQTVAFALLGSGVRVDTVSRILVSIVLMLISTALGLWITHDSSITTCTTKMKN